MNKMIVLGALLFAACQADDDGVVADAQPQLADAEVHADASTFPVGIWDARVVSPCMDKSIPMLTSVAFTSVAATLTFASGESIYTEWALTSPSAVSTGGRPLNATLRVESAAWTLGGDGLHATIHYTMASNDVCTVDVLAVLEEHGKPEATHNP